VKSKDRMRQSCDCIIYAMNNNWHMEGRRFFGEQHSGKCFNKVIDTFIKVMNRAEKENES